ncbi:MAG: CHAT domain-containing protein [Agriterribacter sp.]
MRKQGVILIVFTLCYLFSMSGDPVHIDTISHTYKAADSLFTLPAPTEETDAAAKKNFDEVIAAYNNNTAFPDSFLFNALWKRGVLEEVLGNLNIAKKFYLQSLTVAGRKHSNDDSLEFKPLLYAGGIYYKENRFDSTRLFLEKAYSLTEKYKYSEELERLYNLLGALYFEGGNYLQSKNCFEKALQIVQAEGGGTIRVINFERNIAASLDRLGRYEEALKAYCDLLKYKEGSREISINIGNIYLALNNYHEALKYLHNNSKGAGIEVYNSITYAHLQLKQYDSVAFYLRLFEQGLTGSSKNISRTALGVHEIYKGDYLFDTGNIPGSVQQYQNAITRLLLGYNGRDIHNNPSEFSGVISFFNLYKAIIKKAACFEALYAKTASQQYLVSALETYSAGIKLVDYIEKNLEFDEAKIFLKGNSNLIYSKAIDISMLLHKLTNKNEYLWNAYTIIEKSKSSVLVGNLKAFEIKSKAAIPDDLLQGEKELKYKIARLQIKIDQNHEDSTGLQLATEKRNDELELSVIQNKIRKYTDDGDDENFKADQSFFRSKLKDETAILDLYFSDSLLYVFAITNTDIKTSVTPVANLNLNQVSQVQSGFEHAMPVNQQTSDAVVQNLFATLIQPVFPLIEVKKEWIVLPDGVFYYFPFEIIQNPKSGKMLIEDYAISYNFSIRFINEHETRKKEGLPRLIAVAPFINRGLYSYADSMLLERLPATQMEIAGLNGRILMDTNATKTKFLKGINSYDILHLATHAVMNPGNPSQSYIAFYPQDSTKPDNYKLYLNELYNLNLDSTRLMLLSACETGVGKLVEGEGVMSLSRGVLYAGCPSVITTLWPANDQSTAYIINHFYKYMDDGNDLNAALRLSKLDFIKDYPKQKDPSYWAHLVLVGKTQSLHSASETVNIPLVATISTILIAVYAFLWYRKKRKPAMVRA